MERLYGQGALQALGDAHVAVIGVGGVGSWAVEALARSGVGAITMVDLDDLCVTNTNRQLPAVTGAFGRPKVQLLAERVQAIHPDCNVTAVEDFFGEDTADPILSGGFDWVIDAIDSVPAKVLLVAACVQRQQPLVVSGGAGGRWHTAGVDVADLNGTVGDPLLRRLRKRLRRYHGFSLEGAWGIPTVFSAERQWFPNADGSVSPRTDGSSLRMDCATGLGAATFVTGAFGFAAASVVVTDIARRGTE